MGWVDSLLRRLYLGIQIGRASIYSRGNQKCKSPPPRPPDLVAKKHHIYSGEFKITDICCIILLYAGT